MGEVGGVCREKMEIPAVKEVLSVGPPPPPPPPPSRMTTLFAPPTTSYDPKRRFRITDRSHLKRAAVSSAATAATTWELWDRLFDEAYKADVVVHTDNGGQIYAHASVLGMASPAIKSLLKRPVVKKIQRRSFYVRGVPHDAVRVFLRYLYSSCYELQDMEDFAIHLLVLSHAFAVPHLKRECEQKLEKDMLSMENVVDVFQLALLCDAPRLSLICHRMILNNFKAVSLTEGWSVMKKAHPVLEKQIVESVAEAETRKKAIKRKKEERKMYVQLYEAMEALVHICRDGCRTIGPHDMEPPKEDRGPCEFSACKGLELLLRHFAGCKLRVPGGCAQCKRMWQLLELHSCLCADSDSCRVPLCRNFKERRSRRQSKKEMKWKILAKKILRSKSLSGALYFSLVASP